MTTIAPTPTDLGIAAAEAVRDIAKRVANGDTITMILDRDLSGSWAALEQAGWDEIGVPNDDGGPTLVDLVTVAQAWGGYCLPLPLTPTVLARRWSAAAREHRGPVTVSVPHPSREGGLALFGTFPGAVLAPDLGSPRPRALGPVDAKPEDLAPTLALGRTRSVTAFSPAAARECAVVWAAEAVGAAARLLTEGVSYAKLRRQFDRPIGSFQAVKHLLADAHMLVEQAETAVLWAASDLDAAHRPLSFAFRACRRAGELSIQVHGGVGFTWELGLHFYLRHIMALAEVTGAVLPL